MTYGKLLACAFAAIGLVSLPRPANAIDRLTDNDVKKLLDTIEHDRSEFEAALDDKQKNSTIKGARGEVNANEFFDDFEDQVQRARDRFKSDYSASSEVLSLLQYATRVQGWTATQPAGYRDPKNGECSATIFRRLAAAYNTGLPKPGQQGLGTIAQARRINDEELKTAAANVEKKIDGFRSAYDSALAANTKVTPEMRQSAIGQVDVMKKNAHALNTALDNKQKGIPEADALLKGTRGVIETMSKLPAGSPAPAAWPPLNERSGQDRVGL